MHVALASCASLPDWEVDDRPLHDALAGRGFTVGRPAWDDPSVDWAAFAGCLIRTTWDYHRRRDAFVEWAREVAAVTPLFNPPDIVRWNTDKAYLRDLEARGVPVIPSVWIDAGATVDIAREVRGRGWRAAFLKPAIGATAFGTLRFGDSDDDLARAQRHAEEWLRHSTMLLQPYLASVETGGELSAVFIDGNFSHAVRKTPVPGDYRVQDDFGARDRPETLDRPTLDLARRVVAAVGSDLLYARVDLLADDQDAWRVTEVELVEPSMFFRHEPSAAGRLAAAFAGRIAARP